MRVAGIGCRADTPLETLARSVGDVDVLATIPERAGLLRPLAARLGLPLRIVSVAGVETPTQSPRVQSLHATGSVAEAAALVAAGPSARLTGPRIVSACGRFTIAIAEVP
ncbi:cobalamin biosynthesis protein [Paracoccus sp. R86501]|uniref:cobalamin biosynthesis protein n=1 Tax=Paracoccus sp. R86501 TaxID=3101711 RepID=UPI00366FE6B9